MSDSPVKKIIASVGSLIPGYHGYAAAEERRAEDREVRKLLASRLAECKTELDKRMKSLKHANQFDLLGIADRLRGELDLAQQKTHAAFEGYSGWFAEKKIDDKKLAEVVELDESLISIVDRIAHSLPDKLESVEDINEAGELIELYLQRFDRRNQILHG